MPRLFALLLLLPSLTAVSALKLGIRPALSQNSKAHRSAAKRGVRIQVASKEKGLGAFAMSDIKLGDYIGEYNGEILTISEVRARFWKSRQPDASDEQWAQSRRDRGQGITGDYVLEMKDGRFVCAEDADKSGWCRFLNHSKHDCNVKAFDRMTRDGDLLEFPVFYAIRDIEEGEELSWDYGSFWA